VPKTETPAPIAAEQGASQTTLQPNGGQTESAGLEASQPAANENLMAPAEQPADERPAGSDEGPGRGEQVSAGEKDKSNSVAEGQQESGSDLAARLTEGETGELVMTLIASSLNVSPSPISDTTAELADNNLNNGNNNDNIRHELNTGGELARDKAGQEAPVTSTQATTTTHRPQQEDDSVTPRVAAANEWQRNSSTGVSQETAHQDAQSFGAALATDEAQQERLTRTGSGQSAASATSASGQAAVAGVQTSNSYGAKAALKRAKGSSKRSQLRQQSAAFARTTSTTESYSPPSQFDSGQWKPDTHIDYNSAPGLASYDGQSSESRREGPQTGGSGGDGGSLAGQSAAGGSTLPGRPGIDYPVHWQVPKTSFDCRNYEQTGFYADVESDCQAYHSCHKGRGGRHTFLCPNGTLFSQELLTCDWWYNVECSTSKMYMPNESAGSSSRTTRDSHALLQSAAHFLPNHESERSGRGA